MAALLNPYLDFDGTARGAMTLYRSLFGGDRSVMTFGDMGMTLTKGDNVSVSLSGDDEPELSRWLEALAEGGEVQMPLEKQMWGDVFGQTTDKFGIVWLVNIGQPG